MVARACWLFKGPRALVRHYFDQTVPSQQPIRLRNGKQIRLSHHPLDVVVLFQVFCERVYPTTRNTLVVDVGANIGLFAFYAALHGVAKVYAFEPNLQAYGCMVENINRNGFQDVVVPYHYAVTASSGEEVSIRRTSSPQNRVVRGDVDPREYETVGTISLDDFVRQERLSRVDLLKVDCEGSEYDILAGTSASTFAIIDRIVLEYHDGKADLIKEDLKRHGFTLEKERPETDMMGMLWFGRPNEPRRTAA